MSLSWLSPSTLPPPCPLSPVCPTCPLKVPYPTPVYSGDLFSLLFPGKSTSPSVGPPCYPASLGLWSVGWFFFTPSIYLWVSPYQVCLPGSGLAHSKWWFFSSPMWWILIPLEPEAKTNSLFYNFPWLWFDHISRRMTDPRHHCFWDLCHGLDVAWVCPPGIHVLERRPSRKSLGHAVRRDWGIFGGVWGFFFPSSFPLWRVVKM